MNQMTFKDKKLRFLKNIFLREVLTSKDIKRGFIKNIS